MKKCLNKENPRMVSKLKVTKLTYELYMDACKKIAEDIKENFKKELENEEMELIGIARGGLPMLVTLSHLIGIRKVSMIQSQMSNSDNCHDYGAFRYMSDNIDNSKKKCIILEDIIYKGVTTNGIINILKNRNKEILSVYSLIIDEGFKNIDISNADINIKYMYEIDANDWVYFFWETDLREIE